MGSGQATKRRGQTWSPVRSWFLLGIVALCLLTHAAADAFNAEAKARLLALFERGGRPTEAELIEMLLPVAGDESLSHMQKKRDMTYLVYISGWDLSKEEKAVLFHRVYTLLDKQRKEAYLHTHPELDGRIREAIRKGVVVIGMSMSDVKASLGEPEEVRPPLGTLMNSERWSYYTRRITLYFKGDRLVSWKKSS